MSFILDALRKSEQERQRNQSPGIAEVRTISAPANRSVWIILVTALVTINVILMAFLWFRETPQPTTEPVTAVAQPTRPTATQTAEPENSGAAPTKPPAAAASRNLSQEFTERRSAISQPAETPVSAAVRNPPVTASKPAAQPLYSSIPTLTELALAGSISLPPLHLDIHVYSDNQAERFVFINMDKYREGDSLSEGPAVDTITSEGVILRYQGRKFLVTRQ